MIRINRKRGLGRSARLALGAALAALLVAACGSAGGNSPPAGGTTATGGSEQAGHGKTAVTLWDGITGSNEPSFLSWLKSTPAPVTLNAQELPWSTIYQKLPTAMASGQPPQLMMLHPYDLEPYAQHGDLVSLNSFVNSLVPASVRDSAIWKANSLNGQQFAVPIGQWNVVWFYNKTLWAKAGYPSGPPLDDPTALLAALRKLTVGSGSSKQWGFSQDASDLSYLFQTLMLQEGQPVYTTNAVHLDTPASVKVLDYMRSLVDTYQVEPNPAGANSAALFEQGKLALYAAGQWDIEGFNQYTASGGKLNWGITSAPVVMMPGGKQVSLSGGPAFAISKATGDSSPAQLANEESFIKWAVQTEATWVKGGGLLPTVTSASSASLLKSGSPVNYVAYEQLGYDQAQQTNPGFDTIDGQVTGPFLEKVDTPGSSVASLASAAQSQANGLS